MRANCLYCVSTKRLISVETKANNSFSLREYRVFYIIMFILLQALRKWQSRCATKPGATKCSSSLDQNVVVAPFPFLFLVYHHTNTANYDTDYELDTDELYFSSKSSGLFKCGPVIAHMLLLLSRPLSTNGGTPTFSCCSTAFLYPYRQLLRTLFGTATALKSVSPAHATVPI